MNNQDIHDIQQQYDNNVPPREIKISDFEKLQERTYRSL
jgi:hypothetical protein